MESLKSIKMTCIVSIIVTSLAYKGSIFTTWWHVKCRSDGLACTMLAHLRVMRSSCTVFFFSWSPSLLVAAFLYFVPNSFTSKLDSLRASLTFFLRRNYLHITLFWNIYRRNTFLQIFTRIPPFSHTYWEAASDEAGHVWWWRLQNKFICWVRDIIYVCGLSWPYP